MPKDEKMKVEQGYLQIPQYSSLFLTFSLFLRSVLTQENKNPGVVTNIIDDMGDKAIASKLHDLVCKKDEKDKRSIGLIGI